MKLTHEDIGLLIEALDAWVQRKQSGELVGDLIEGLLSSKGDDKNAMRAEREVRRREAAREKQLDADTATLLKAKLIRLRQEEFAA